MKKKRWGLRGIKWTTESASFMESRANSMKLLHFQVDALITVTILTGTRKCCPHTTTCREMFILEARMTSTIRRSTNRALGSLAMTTRDQERKITMKSTTNTARWCGKSTTLRTEAETSKSRGLISIHLLTNPDREDSNSESTVNRMRWESLKKSHRLAPTRIRRSSSQRTQSAARTDATLIQRKSTREITSSSGKDQWDCLDSKARTTNIKETTE